MVLPKNNLKALETIYVSGQRILNDQPQQASLQQAFWNSFSSPVSPTFTSITFDSTFESLSSLIWLIQTFWPQTLTLTNCENNYPCEPDERDKNKLSCTPPFYCFTLFHKAVHFSKLTVTDGKIHCQHPDLLDELDENKQAFAVFFCEELSHFWFHSQIPQARWSEAI